MGVEPTAARSARPATDFEDREHHRALSISTRKYNDLGEYLSTMNKMSMYNRDVDYDSESLFRSQPK